MKKYIIHYIISFLLIIISLLVFKLFFSGTSHSNFDVSYKEAFMKNYKIFALDIPDTIYFAGERVPTEKYYVRESIDQELVKNTYGHSTTILMFKRANRWFPIIEPILKKHNIPSDFKYLALIESYFENNSSSKGAAGYWQFMPITAIDHDLEVTDDIDERLNVEKATEAACLYIRSMYKRYKNWTLAAASYNVGEYSLNNSLNNQKVEDYHDLFLNKETARYVYRIIAVKLIFKHPQDYGFYIRKKDLYSPIPTEYIEVDTTINDLVDFSIKHGINYKILKELNPWLRKSFLNNKDRKKYQIKVLPKGYNPENLFKTPSEYEMELIENDSLGI
ncbi:MAG: hypothetical protein A2X12_04285 [Bacteroidetes bacterium GWE2_29_8]|nr:MAG: hypothetical protein A2X12_04285 [Bacteroidetes bacterium GWE2_29_8]OFY16156.1 MAG: hypothetical protein A2X02_10125 [Bacteroidetes bacterium GWF2_29_10]